MPRQSSQSQSQPRKKGSSGSGDFHIEFKNEAQNLAWASFQQHDVLFLIGPAGTGKSFLACAFAVEQILNKQKSKLVLTRPIVEAGESLGFLPGEFEEKVHPYMLPMYDCIDKLVGRGESPQRDKVERAMEVAPIAYMRGRAIKNDELIPVPFGYKQMGKIKKGDLVIGSNGQPTRVTAVYPQGKVKLYEIKFSDGTKSICCENHLWSTMTIDEKRHNKGFSAKKTKDIIGNVKNKHGQKIHRVPVISEAVAFDERSVSIDPYFLGVLLGDGHISSKNLSITTADAYIADACFKALPKTCEMVYRGKYDYRIQSGRQLNELRVRLRELELCDLKSYNKFVPDDYKFNTKECRLAILQGLLDTDGWICKHRSGNCRIQFCSTSKRLADDVMFLVRSLGGMAYSRMREFDESDSHEHNGKIIRHARPAYVVDIVIGVNPFRLPRKAKQYKKNQTMTKMISSIVEVEEGEATCISVDAEDHLFLTNDFIVTHNTFDDAICIFDEAQNATLSQLKLFLTRFGENSKLIITGDPMQSDLPGEVALTNVMHRLSGIPGIGILQFKNKHIVRHHLIGKILEQLES